MTKGNLTIITEFILLGFSLSPALEVSLFVLFLAVYVITLVGNIAVITLTSLDVHLQTPMYFFLCNLAVLNICCTSAVVPKMLANFLATRKSISPALCVAQMYISLFLGAAECIFLAVMAIDRYVAICHPLRYAVLMNKRVCVGMAAGSWIMTFLGSVVPLSALQLPLCGFNVIDHYFCEVPAMLQLVCADTSVSESAMFMGGIATEIFPFILILLSYIRIMVAILRITSAKGRQKAFSTCSAHLMVVTIFYTTAMLMYMRSKEQRTAEQDKVISVFYTIINPMINPIIYSLRNAEIKRALTKLVGRTKMAQG
ncbi:olfactory receptor 10A7-like [Hemicordylus capensis]|uniref:olfactory receptor 10A7-like n=1 Tax=Hemicordylus capensis TaxID=884348 RepID=UPI002303F378|nr:olfactory receptor 10A7-like [Hemicordylus capensis]